MLSYLIAMIFLLALGFGGLSGHIQEVSQAAMSGAASAITIAVTLAGPLCLWSGVGELMKRSGIRDKLTLLLSPVLGRIFPELRNHRGGFSALSANVTANLLGLGNAATPMGIEACKAMGRGEVPTDGQCRLIVMNSASIQLIPTTIAALRASLGSASPLNILPAVLLSSLCSVTAGLLACFLFSRWSFHRDR